jgi:lipoate-protein ligase A
MRARGWEIVRRPTGGRAILHTDELTYSIAGPQDDPLLTGGVLESYRRLSLGLVRAVELLGLPVRAQEKYPLPQGASPAGPVCFDVPSNYEVTAGGKKLIGSAQARKKEGVLQHGSLPLVGSLARITEVLVFPSNQAREEAAVRLLEHATTVETVLGRQVSWEEAAGCFSQGFAESLNMNLVEDSLSPAENEIARRLVQEKYACQDWSARV